MAKHREPRRKSRLALQREAEIERRLAENPEARPALKALKAEAAESWRLRRSSAETQKRESRSGGASRFVPEPHWLHCQTLRGCGIDAEVRYTRRGPRIVLRLSSKAETESI